MLKQKCTQEQPKTLTEIPQKKTNIKKQKAYNDSRLTKKKKNELNSSTGLAEKNKSLEQRFDFVESLKLNSIANI